MWEDVGTSLAGEAKNSQGKSPAELLWKSALVAMIGSWGPTQNYRSKLLVSSNFEDVPWNGQVHVKPSPGSEATEGGFVFHDVIVATTHPIIGDSPTLEFDREEPREAAGGEGAESR